MLEKNVEILNETREKFLKMPLGKLIAANAMPAVASMLFMALYQIIDGIMVGRRLGADALASINVLYPIFALMSGIAVMIGIGGNARIAVLLGAGDDKKASRILGLIVLIGVIIGILFGSLNLIFMPQILNLLGSFEGNLGVLAGQYLMGFIPFYVFLILMFILEQSVRNDGSPNLASGVMAGCALLNIALDYIFLFVLDIGIIGASLASGISQTVGGLIFVIYFIKKSKNKKSGLLFAKPILNMNIFKGIVINGSSELFNSIAIGITTFLFNRMIITNVGAIGVASFSVVQYLLMIGMFITLGIGNGCQPIFSYNHGAKLRKRVYGTLWRVGAICFIVGIMVFVLMIWQTTAAVQLFLPDQAEAIALSLEISNYVKWSLLFMPLGMLASIYFTAIEQAKKSLIIAVSRSLAMPVIGLFLFTTVFGTVGIWITPVFSELITVLIFFYILQKKKANLYV